MRFARCLGDWPLGQSPSAARSAGRVSDYRADGWGLSSDKCLSVGPNSLYVHNLIDRLCGETPPVARSARHPPRLRRWRESFYASPSPTHQRVEQIAAHVVEAAGEFEI